VGTRRGLNPCLPGSAVYKVAVMKRRPVVVAQSCAPLMSTALVSLLAVGAGLSTLLRPGSVAAMVPAEGGWTIISGGGSAV
jgi:hypothetical protein